MANDVDNATGNGIGNSVANSSIDIVRSQDGLTYTVHLLTGKPVNICADRPERALLLLQQFLRRRPSREQLLELARSSVQTVGAPKDLVKKAN